MLTPESLRIPVRFGSADLLNRTGYQFGEEPDNPVLRLFRGFRYEFDVRVSEDHPLAIKTAPGLLYSNSYTTGISNSGITNGLMTWEVNELTPSRLVYQSVTDPSICGLIVVDTYGAGSLTKPQPINLNGEFADDLQTFVRKVNLNNKMILLDDPELAGPGLVYEDRQLSLDMAAGTTFYQNEEGQIIRADETFALPEQPVLDPTNKVFGLKQAIVQLAAYIRSIKDPSRNLSAQPAATVRELNERTRLLQGELTALTQQVLALKNRVNND